MFEQIDDSQRLPVVLEAAARLRGGKLAHQIVEDFFAGVAEGRMPQIVRQAYRLGKALV